MTNPNVEKAPRSVGTVAPGSRVRGRGKVVCLAEHRNKDTIAALEGLLEEAKRGDLSAFAYCVQTGRGSHRVGVTGRYERDPGAILMASAHLNNRAQRLLEDSE